MPKGLTLGLGRWSRFATIVALYGVLAAAANWISLLLRFDGLVPAENALAWRAALPWILGVRVGSLVLSRVHQGMWRYASLWDLRRLALAVIGSSGLLFVLIYRVLGLVAFPRSVLLIDTALLILFTGGARIGVRALRSLPSTSSAKRVLVFGAGDAGELVLRDIRQSAHSTYRPVGIIDDDVRKHGTLIHGVRVVGGRDRLGEFVERLKPTELIIAVANVEARTIRDLLSTLDGTGVAVTRVGGIERAGHTGPLIDGVRSLSVNDLLNRPPVTLDPQPVAVLLRGSRVLVTGAGGSIGSELCRQILAWGPEELVALDQHENSLFEVLGTLRGIPSTSRITGVIADVADVQRLEQVFATQRPLVVFHAAAHKHVPLMEDHPCEAVKNNVGGTKAVIRAAIKAGVERCIVVSSDKAVNPTSVMGATKRIGELLVKAQHEVGATQLSTVRFGNVLGSNGSVVPKFLAQIESGQPLTITHPEITRYFMTIPEAVQLVLQAAALEGPGLTYVLDMGEPVSILELARTLVRLSGRDTNHVPLEFTGLRPGEKLYEELVGSNEGVTPSVVPCINTIHDKRPAVQPSFWEDLAELETLAVRGDEHGVRALLQRIVPEMLVDATVADAGKEQLSEEAVRS